MLANNSSVFSGNSQNISLHSPTFEASAHEGGTGKRKNDSDQVAVRPKRPCLNRSATSEFIMGKYRKKPVRVPDGYIDTLFRFGKFLSGTKFLGKIPDHLIGTEVAIVGGGVSGLATAYELMKVGLKPVIYELTDKLNGRLDSRHFTNEKGEAVAAFADLGAMRFPLSGRAFWHYMREFGMDTGLRAPLMGEVPGKLYINGRVVNWPVGSEKPEDELLCQLDVDFGSFFAGLLKDVRAAEAADDHDGQVAAFQKLLDDYAERTVYDCLHDIKRGDTGEKWGRKEIEMFGVIGSGIGGVAPYFGNTLIDFLRESINRMDDDLFSLPEGAESFSNRFYTHKTMCHDGIERSLEEVATVHYNTRVSDLKIDPTLAMPTLEFMNEDGDVSQASYRAIMTTPTPPALQAMHVGMEDTENSDQIVTRSVRQAIDGSRMVIPPPKKRIYK